MVNGSVTTKSRVFGIPPKSTLPFNWFSVSSGCTVLIIHFVALGSPSSLVRMNSEEILARTIG